MTVKYNDLVVIKDKKEWLFHGDIQIVNKKKCVYSLDATGEMKKLLGAVVKVSRILLQEDSFVDSKEWIWSLDAIEKIVTKKEDPEYFL